MNEEEKKKYNQLYSEFNEVQQKFEKQLRILNKKETEFE